MTPSELYALASDWWESHKDDNGVFSPEIKRLMADQPQHVTPAAISRAFGTPKPTLDRLLSTGTAEPAHVPDADGLFQPDHGGELGIESAVLRGPGR